METSMKDNHNIKYQKVWRRKKKEEYQVNENSFPVMLSCFVKAKCYDESTRTFEDVKF